MAKKYLNVFPGIFPTHMIDKKKTYIFTAPTFCMYLSMEPSLKCKENVKLFYNFYSTFILNTLTAKSVETTDT